MSKPSLSRREFFTRTATVAGLTGAAGLLISACGKSSEGLTCEPHGLSLADTQTRTTNKYTDQAPVAAKHCANCQLFKPAGDPKTCGACTVVKGPISPAGYCNLWAEKKA